MKKHSIIILFIALFSGAFFTANAQAPYKNSFGVTVGNMQALSFKTFGSNHFAFQVDLGTKITCTDGRVKNNYTFSGWDIWTLELNPNFIFDDQTIEWDDTIEAYREKRQLKKLTILPIIPAFSDTYNF